MPMPPGVDGCDQSGLSDRISGSVVKNIDKVVYRYPSKNQENRQQQRHSANFV